MGKDRSYKDILKEVEEKRGYLLSHHEFFGYSDPVMLEKYDQLYENLTLRTKFLDNRVKELVWLGILTAVFEEAGGPIHIKRARDAGVTDDEISEVLILTQIARGFDALSFVEEKWEKLLPNIKIMQVYDGFIKKLTAHFKIPENIVELIFIGLYSSLRKKSALRFHLSRAKEYDLHDEEIYEAMSYILLPCGAPTLIDAVNVLKNVIQKGDLTPDSTFKKWISDEK